MTAKEILSKIGSQQDVRNFLRGVEEGSEMDLDAQRAMLAAIRFMPGAGVYDAMAAAEPELYAQACLMSCQLWTDGYDPDIERQMNAIVLQLRYHEKNIKEEVSENGKS
ncbi:MAG: hypothetical protein IKK34_14120 [Clostridia bacterium]|nr:hypothetical protein [Clostridia bacterium]